MMDYTKIPLYYMLSGMKRYVEDGVKPGSFLTAVLENDLRQAVHYADANNLQLLPHWVGFCWTELPEDIWGSPAKVQRHLESFVQRS